MANGPVLVNSALAQSEVKRRSIPFLLTFNIDPTIASITITSDNEAIVPYWYNGAQPVPSDSGANFGTLTVDATSVIGLLINDGSARSYRFTDFTVTPDLSPSITTSSITVEKDGSNNTGVTASRNVALSLSIGGLFLNSTATSQLLGGTVEYFQY